MPRRRQVANRTSHSWAETLAETGADASRAPVLGAGPTSKRAIINHSSRCQPVGPPDISSDVAEPRAAGRQPSRIVGSRPPA